MNISQLTQNLGFVLNNIRQSGTKRSSKESDKVLCLIQ